MRNLLFVFVVGALALTTLAGSPRIAGAGELDFQDEFDSFDAGRWAKGDHRLGRSYLDPDNVGVSGGNLAIRLPARTLDGGEILTNDLYGYGSYAARMRLPYAPTSITGFFLYKSPDYEHEIDIEVYNDSSRRVMFTTYAAGSQTHTETMLLPFDPTAGFHEYRFDYAPGKVSFYADGQLMKEWNDGIPQASMHLMVNAWFPGWLGGKKPRKTTYALVDSIRHLQQ